MICLLRTDHTGRTGTFQVRKRSGWDGGLKVEASGKGLVGHAGAVLLHRTADRIDLVGRLRGGLRASPWLLDRADVLVSLVVGIALGAVNLAQAELLARHHNVVLGGQALGLDAVARARGRSTGGPGRRSGRRVPWSASGSGRYSRRARRDSRGSRSWARSSWAGS